MAQQDRADLCIIGAGPAGLAAADMAASLGARVVLVEAGEIGGVSHNWGSLPAQALAQAADRAHLVRHSRDFGLAPGDPRVNFARINARIGEVIAAATPDISPERLTAAGIELVRGRATFSTRDSVEVEGRTIRARHFLLATGSRPLVPDIPGLETVPSFTPETIFEITRKPSHLLVVGGGATGLSLAQSHLRLGSAVTVIDMVDPLSDFDPELAEAVLRRLKAEGLVMRSNTGVVALGAQGEEISVEIKSGALEETLAASHILFATGRRPVLDQMGLEAARVRLEGGLPVLKGNGRSTNRRIFFAGDAAGTHGAHAARHAAERAVAAMLGGDRRQAIVPATVHTRPAIAQLGLTETQALARFGQAIAVTRAPFAHTQAARAAGQLHGHIKMITRPGGAIVGVGIVGPAATELAPLFALAMGQGVSAHDLSALIAPHPSYGEAVSDLAAQYQRAHPKKGNGAWLPAIKRLLP